MCGTFYYRSQKQNNVLSSVYMKGERNHLGYSEIVKLGYKLIRFHEEL